MEKWEYNTDQYTEWEINYKIIGEEKASTYLAKDKDIYKAIEELRNNKDNIEKLLSIRDVARTGSNYNFNKLHVLDMYKVNCILGL